MDNRKCPHCGSPVAHENEFAYTLRCGSYYFKDDEPGELNISHVFKRSKTCPRYLAFKRLLQLRVAMAHMRDWEQESPLAIEPTGNELIDRLRGIYKLDWHTSRFPSTKINREAADKLAELQNVI